MGGGLIPLEEARARLLAGVRATPPEHVPLAHALGRTLAVPIVARYDQPPAAMSAMDGYAVRLADWPGPWRVIAESAAGGASVPGIGAGEAARIFTGARVPDGADAVLIQEEAAREGDALRPTRPDPPPHKDNIRHRGFDFRAGAHAGILGGAVTPALIGLAAAMGHATLEVHARPRIAILSTGDELVAPGAVPGPGQIVESCAPMLAALIHPFAEPLPLGIAPDRADAIGAALDRARAAGADAIVTIGGASVGDHDLVRPSLLAAGGAIDFWRVAIRPGKPMLAGRIGDALVLGLPGNPASAFVTAHLFLLPLARALAGWTDPVPHLLPARLGAPLPASGNRRDHLRATLSWAEGGLWATPIARQDSSLLSVLAQSDALIVRAEHAPAAGVGEWTEVLDTRISRF